MELGRTVTTYEKEQTVFKSNLILGMCFIYMIQFVVESHWFNLFLSAFATIVFVSSLSGAKLVPRFLAISMFSLGVFLNLLKGNALERTMDGIVTNLPLLSLVILAPLLSIPLKLGGYFQSVLFYLERLRQSPQKMFGSITFFLFCLGPILNMGSIRILDEMIKDLKLNPSILAKSYLIGYTTVILWSPYSASVALVLHYLHVPMIHYLPYGITLALVQLAIGNLLFAFWVEKNGKAGPAKIVQADDVKHGKKIRELAFMVIFLIGITFFIEYVTHWSILFVVSLIIIAFSVLWSAINHKWDEFGKNLQDFKILSIPLMNNEIVMLISAGLFGKALIGTDFSYRVKLFLNHISEFSFMLFIITVLTIILVITLIGINPVAVITLLVTQMDPMSIGTTPEVLAMLLLISWMLSSILSPLNPLNMLVSNSVNQSGLQVGLRANGIFLLVMFVVAVFLVYFIHKFKASL